MQDADRPLEPLDVEVHVDQRLMRIRWNDGHEAVYGFETLRWACPCAQCAGEGNVPGMLSRIKVLSEQQTQMVDLQQVGRYGLTPVWADGHATGIYSYRMLRALCECPACKAARGA
ncbi:MAG TPA: DUF971 domain-containing protein [Chloroflexota bacterium]|nr:DUF971 domain-containing protein [Chloroflexota bacterium]